MMVDSLGGYRAENLLLPGDLFGLLTKGRSIKQSYGEVRVIYLVRSHIGSMG